MKIKAEMLKEVILLAVGLVLMTITNSYSYGVGIFDSVKGIGLLCVIAFIGMAISKFMSRFIKLPTFLYVSLLAMLLASPICPISDWIYGTASKMEFLTPTTALGAFSGISLGKDLKTFAKTGWKLALVGLLVILGTFLGSAIIAQVIMKLMGTI